MLYNLIKKINSALAKGLESKSGISDCPQKSILKRKSGFTIVELMVVIIMVNLLSGVAIPKCTGLIEKSKERIDMLKLYYLRDAMDRALYEDQVTNMSDAKCGNVKNDATQLNNYMKQKLGVSLFVIETHQIAKANYQGVHNKASGNNMCGLLIGGGFWYTALKEAGMEAVADIVADRANNNKFNYNSKTYTTESYKVDDKNTWTRTYPTNAVFKSKALNGGNDRAYTGTNQKRLTMRVRWLNCDENSHSVEVFMYDETKKAPLQGQFTTFFTGSNFNTSKCK